MGKTHKEQLELKNELEAAMAKVTVGAKYTHYKGADKIYLVTGLGFLKQQMKFALFTVHFMASG